MSYIVYIVTLFRTKFEVLFKLNEGGFPVILEYYLPNDPIL